MEVTQSAYTVGVHWLRGVTLSAGLDEVLEFVANWTGDSVERRRGGGLHGYSDGYLVGPVSVFHHPEYGDMGVCVDVAGEGCEALGPVRVAELAVSLELRASRLDLAVDGARFSPDDLRREWFAGAVRTRVEKPDAVRLAARGLRVLPGLEEIPNHGWHSGPTGTTFDMGVRASEQFARVYDMRGPTRFELELKGKTAAAAAPLVWAAIEAGELGVVALGLIRRFVDFVEVDSSEHVSRRSLSGFWAEFVEGAERAVLLLGNVVERTLDEVWEWLEHQAGPALALVASAGRLEALGELARRGRRRWKEKHWGVLKRSPDWSVPLVAGAVV